MKTFYRARGCRLQPPGLTLLIMCLLLAPAAAKAADPAAVHDAAAGGDLERVQRLVVDGADVNSAGADGDTPLIVATLAGHGDVVNYLLQRGADIGARNAHGLTALHAAAYAGHADIVALLLAKGAVVDDDGNRFEVRPLHLAAEENHVGVVELLLQHGADLGALEANGYSALTRAGFREHWVVLEMLLAAGGACQDAGKVGEWLHGECSKRAGVN